MKQIFSGQHEVFAYVSTKANTYTPAKTIIVCAPERFCYTRESAEEFAKSSGWLDAAENDAAVLVMPVVKNGWDQEELGLIVDIYDDVRDYCKTNRSGVTAGWTGFVWCVETLVYLAGYEDGAVFAGNVTVAYPGRFSGVALIDGVPNDYSSQSEQTCHWFVKNVSSDYQRKNVEVPVCLWLFAKNEADTQEALSYFFRSNGQTSLRETLSIDGISTRVYKNAVEEARQIRLSTGDFAADSTLPGIIMDHLFNRFIRWKSSPDGDLKPYLGRDAFYASDRFIHDEITVNGTAYEYHIHLPKGLGPKDVKDLPLVLSIHGRGEPAWLCSTKNAWDRLADETKQFVLVLPDSPKNIWLPERDCDMFGRLIDKLNKDFGIDKTRVYLTGFSNGGMITRQTANVHPEQFAAISPWNAPFADTFEQLLSSGYELPCFVCAGDNDEKAPLWDDFDSLIEDMLKVNHCAVREGENRDSMKFIPDAIYTDQNYYTSENGYTDGDRFQTFLYQNPNGRVRVCFTLMKNMPHGAVYDQSRVAWAFMKRFSRPNGSKTVIESDF